MKIMMQILIVVRLKIITSYSHQRQWLALDY